MLVSEIVVTVLACVIGIVFGIPVAYAIVRIVSSAIFRSWFNAKNHFNDKENKYGR